MHKKRFVLEGIWSGYSSSQRRVCHRVVITNPGRYKDLKFIRFTDNTYLELSIRPCKPREVVRDIIKGYVDLIEDCLMFKVDSVAEISEIRKLNKEKKGAK